MNKMGTFMMICYVMASFLKPGTDETFDVPREKIGTFIQAPEWVKDTLEFKLLMQDKSIRVAAETRHERLKLENDPMDGIGADGKAETIEANDEVENVDVVESDAEVVSKADEVETVSKADDAETEEIAKEPVKAKKTSSRTTTRKTKKDDAE